MNYNKALQILNISAFLQQQRYLLPVTFLFYLYNGLTLPDFIAFQGVYYLVIVLATIPAGYIADRFQRKHILIFAYMLFLGRILLWLFSSGYFVILIGEILYALSKSFYKTSDGYIYEYLQQNNVDNKMIQCYGKYNFYISMSTALSAVLGSILYKSFGFKTILSIELILHISAILLLLFLPNVINNTQITADIKISKINFICHVKNIFKTVKDIVTNKSINKYILFSSILMGITSLYVSLFQPTMKTALVPVVLFGVLYFINHIIRAFSSLYTYKILNKIKIKIFSISVYLSFCISFGVLLLAQKILNAPLCFFLLLIICVAIGLSMMFNVITVGKVQESVPSEIRASVSSVQNMGACLCSCSFLFVYRHLIEIIPKENVLIIFLVLFIPSVFIVKKLYNNQEKA